MENEYIRQGATFEVSLLDDDLTAQMATLTLSQDGVFVQDATASYAEQDGKMIATIKMDTIDLELGSYDAMYTIDYSDDHVEKFPTASDLDCDESDEPCEFPQIIVCEANDVEVS